MGWMHCLSKNVVEEIRFNHHISEIGSTIRLSKRVPVFVTYSSRKYLQREYKLTLNLNYNSSSTSVNYDKITYNGD